MDTKSKNSHRLGVIVVLLLLAACSVTMMLQYTTIKTSLEAEEEVQSQYINNLYEMGNDLAEGNYILYNEYAKETDSSVVLEEYGKLSFDLIRKYADCEVFDSEGEPLLKKVSSTTAGYLSEDDSDYYAFRAEYTFSSTGELAGIQVDGNALEPEQAYGLENYFLDQCGMVANSYGVSSIAVITDVTIIYGMTEGNLDAYCEANSSYVADISSVRWSPAYSDTYLLLCIVTVMAALFLPCVKRLDISDLHIFRVDFEIAALVLFLGYITESVIFPSEMVFETINGTLLPGMGHGAEIIAIPVNFLMWMFVYGVLFWCVTSLRAVVRMKGAYWRERLLIRKLFHRIRHPKEGDPVGKKLNDIFRKVRSFLEQQYDALLHLDIQNQANRTIFKIVAVNFIFLMFVCCFWFFGIFALMIYSILLFLFLRKYVRDLQEKYRMLLQSTNQLAAGRLDIPIEGDAGLFNPLQEELKKIQKGFKKAVDEEVKNERMKTELVTNVSHDLRTPLTAIITYTDLLKNEKDEEKRKEYVEVLERKSLRLKVLIEDLFEISKAASKSVSMHFMKVDIVNLMKEVGLENDSKIKAANLEFRWKLPEQKVIMWLDSQKTYRILENLVVNITKYAMPHTRVYIELTEQENSVHISMKNVSATELNFNTDEITDRFVRGDSSRNTEGSGLGLAIAKSFAELQHGTLKISTEADLFKADVTLPKLEIPAEEDRQDLQEHQDQQGQQGQPENPTEIRGLPE